MGEMNQKGLKKFKNGPFKKAIHMEMTLATPDGLTCPISMHLMTDDPVLAADGFTYERQYISEWIDKNKDSASILSPVTGEPLANTELRPNVTIRNMARDFQKK